MQFLGKFTITSLMLLGAVSQSLAAPLPEKVTLTCKFAAAETPNRIKPGAKNVSDGMIRINPETWTLKICKGCAWEKSGAKWQVTEKEYHAKTPTGIDISITRADGAAKLVLTAHPDEYYQGGKVESTGQCTQVTDAAKQ